MKVLVVGSGGREHTLVWKLNQSSQVEKIFAAPGNPGTAELAVNVEIKADEIAQLVDFAREKEIDWTFVGPENPLVEGIVDQFQAAGLNIFGPQQEAAQLEGSKVFAKNLMKEYDIPTADYKVFTEPSSAITYIEQKGAPIVIKAEGLAGGKGAFVAETEKEAVKAVKTIMIDKEFGSAGERVIIEEQLTGEEATVLAFTDGETIVPLISSQDHKPVYDNDEGPNTGGMGAYAPAPVVTKEVRQQVQKDILQPTLKALQEKGINYKGLIYCGLMISETGKPRVLEYNVRFGDPEAQVVLPLLETDLIEIAEAIKKKRLQEIKLEWSTNLAVCVVMASGGYPVDYKTGRKIAGIEQAKAENRVVFQAGTAQQNGKLVTDGGRVLGVTAFGNDYQTTIEQAYRGVDKINFAEAHYRTDIGRNALVR